jgi:four helix bundle protein
MPTINSFRDLIVWQKSLDLAVRCYILARQFPRADQAVLGHEIQKSAVSIPSNIAEGQAGHYTPKYINHLRIAQGSRGELETQLEIGQRVRLVTQDEADILIADAQEIARMLHGLIGSLDVLPTAHLPPRG